MAGGGQALSRIGGFALIVMLALFLVSCGGSTHSPPQIPSLQSTDATQPVDKEVGLAGPGSGNGDGGGDPLDGASGGAYATTLGDLFTGEMPVLGPVVGSVVAPLPGGGSTQVNVIEDFDPFTVMYQVLEDGRIIVTNRDLTLGLERPEEIWPTEIWIDPETQESWEVYSERLLVTFDSTVTTSQLEALFEEHELEVDFSWFEPLAEGLGNQSAWFHFVFEGDLQTKLDALSQLPCVENASPYFTEILEEHYAPPNDPLYPICRHLYALRVVPSHLVPLPPPYSNQIVAVFDSGVLASHPNLENKVTNVDVFAWGDEYQVFNNHIFPPARWDHGTCVAGLISAATNNELGVACCAPQVKALPVRIAEGQRETTFNLAAIITAVRALREAFPHGGGQTPGFWYQYVRIANMSLGSVATSQDLPFWLSLERQILADLGPNDRLYVASAGNVPQVPANSHVYPAAFLSVLGVSGVVPNYDLNEWYIRDHDLWGSNYLDDGYTTYPVSGIFNFYGVAKQYTTGYSYINGQFSAVYKNFRGTSASVPQVSALAALLYTARPTAKWWEVSQHIVTYHHIYDPGDPNYNPHPPIAYLADFDRALANW